MVLKVAGKCLTERGPTCFIEKFWLNFRLVDIERFESNSECFIDIILLNKGVQDDMPKNNLSNYKWKTLLIESEFSVFYWRYWH